MPHGLLRQQFAVGDAMLRLGRFRTWGGENDYENGEEQELFHTRQDTLPGNSP